VIHQQNTRGQTTFALHVRKIIEDIEINRNMENSRYKPMQIINYILTTT
jgi:hypothetical protein